MPDYARSIDRLRILVRLLETRSAEVGRAVEALRGDTPDFVWMDPAVRHSAVAAEAAALGIQADDLVILLRLIPQDG